MHPARGAPPLVLGCHHKTGSILLIQLMDRLAPKLTQQGRLNRIVNGSPIDRKAHLSGILNHYKGCDCYMNLWFEHEIDVPADSIRLLHFVRHPVKWVRSAYLYHKNGAPSDLIRWLDWRVFRLKGAQLSYCQLLNQLDTSLGLAIETVRAFPEIIGTARVARTSSHLASRLQLSLEQVHESFEVSIASFCTFVGFGKSETEKLIDEFKDLDLARQRQGSLPANVTRISPEAPELERALSQDPLFSRLFAAAAEDMGFQLSKEHLGARSILPERVVNELVDGKGHVSTHWQAAERMKDFMLRENGDKWWPAYVLQVPGCGHLMMHSFIQQLLDDPQ